MHVFVSHGLQCNNLLEQNLFQSCSSDYRGIRRRHGDMQAFLRCRGLDLDGCSVVRQAQVTHIADTNSAGP